MAPALAYY